MLSSDVRQLENENHRLRKALDSMKEKFGEETPKPKACEYCKFYIQHYIKIDGRYSETYCGHCTHGRVKDRKPKDTCKYFELGTYDIKHLV